MRNFFVIFIILLFIFNNNLELSAKKKPAIPVFQILKDSILAPGVIYRNAVIGRGRIKHSAHIIEIDLVNPLISTAVLKANNHVNELEKLQSMIVKYDSLHPETKTIAAINANFWRAYSNRPIGPTIINGEIAEMQTHKQWTSGFFNKMSMLYIDTFFLSGTVKFPTGTTLNISKVNRRSDSLGVVIYNKFSGDTIPYIKQIDIDKSLNIALQDTSFNDSTEVEMDTLTLLETIKMESMVANIENRMKKIAVQYLEEPAVNKNIPCVIRAIYENGHVKMPTNGVIISIGEDFRNQKFGKINDTINIKFSTNIYDSVMFHNSVSGTPRLVRKGVAKHEAREEGSRSRRFINKALPRTALGTNKSKTKIYFVVAEGANGSKKTRGVSLADFSYVMKTIGCYDAMNLDGGGSSMMVINNNNILRANPQAGRAISVGLSVIQRIIEEKQKDMKLFPD